MSTSYYLRRIPTVDKTNEIIKKLKDGVAKSIVEASTMLDESTRRILIGHRMGGWTFRMSVYLTRLWQPTKKSLIEYAHDNNCIVENEYGEVFTIEEFFELVDDWNNDNKNVTTTSSYYEANPDELRYYMMPMHGNVSDFAQYNPNRYYEFFNDSYRWVIEPTSDLWEFETSWKS